MPTDPNDPNLPTPIRPYGAGTIPGPTSGVPPPEPVSDIPMVMPPSVNPTDAMATPDFRFYEGWKDEAGWHVTQLPLEDREVTGPDAKPIKNPGLRSILKRQVDEEEVKRITEVASVDKQMALVLVLAELRSKVNLSPIEQTRLSDSNNLLARLNAIREFADRHRRMIDTFTFEQVKQWTLPHQWPK